MNRVLLIILFTSLTFLNGCTYNFPASPPKADEEPGSLKTDRLIFAGGSITAGVTNGALYKQGQYGSYAALFSQKLHTLNADIPTGIMGVESTTGYNQEASAEQGKPMGRYILKYEHPDDELPVRFAMPGDAPTAWVGRIDTVNNFGVPGLKIFQFDDETALASNPYFSRFSNQMPGSSLLDIIIAQNPTTIVLELGYSDVYNFALSGATANENPAPGNIQTNDLTPTNTFEHSYNAIINRIETETQADIILSTIPDPLLLPYLTSVRWYFKINELGASFIGDLDGYYSSFSTDVQEYNSTAPYDKQRPKIFFDVQGYFDGRARVIVDKDLEDATNSDGQTIPKYRQMTELDMMTYPAYPKLMESLAGDKKFATENPAPDRYVLTRLEQKAAQNRLREFNSYIKDKASSDSRIHVLDIAAYLESIDAGEVSFEGVSFSTEFSRNTVISADGYTFNARGNALIANLLIKLINADFGSTFRVLNVNKFPGNEISNDF